MLLKVGAVLASIPLAAGGMVAATGVVVVDVQEAAGQRLVLPVPLLALETAAHFVPDRVLQEAIGRIELAHVYLPAAEEALAALAESPDAELVRVEDGEERVVVRKAGDRIEVRVDSRRERVAVNVPLSVVRDAVREAHHGRLDAADLVSALRRSRLTDMVEVVDGDERVKISVW